MITFTNCSPFTGQTHTMEFDLTPEQFEASHNAWRSGVLIQNAFPTLTAGEREFIKTGISPAEWANLFGTEEE